MASQPTAILPSRLPSTTAPAPSVETGYTPEDIQKGIGFRQKAATETARLDIDAARKAASEAGKVATVGYCWGGFLSWCAATRLNGLSGSVV